MSFERPLAGLTDSRVREVLTHCCGSPRWVAAMMSSRPFLDRDALFASCDRAFALLEEADWLAAFAHHPKIGDVASLREKFAGTAAWASEEQKGAAEASEETLKRLADGNRAYEERFGYIFIVSATGKSAKEMLGLLENRYNNEPDVELVIAAGEQKKITRLRLEKALAEGDSRA